jgi:amino acid transporter
VIIPCLLNIFGAILFVRLPWAVGQSGWFGVVLQFVLGGSLVTLTTLSIAAISTNGLVRGGGAYYMLSRSLGPEFGVAVGVAYYCAASISIAFYLIAFSENMVSCLNAGDAGSSFITGFPGQDSGLQLAIGSLALLLLLVQAQCGADSVAKANSLVFLLLVVSIALAMISFLTAGGHSEAYLAQHGYRRLNWETFQSNAWKPVDTRQCLCEVTGASLPSASVDDSGTCGQLKCKFDHKCSSGVVPGVLGLHGMREHALYAGVGASPDVLSPSSSNASSSYRWIVPPEYACPTDPEAQSDDEKGASPTGFFQVFIVIFPAVTGIMAGTNFSGDLADPGKSIGFGTLVAIASSIVVYLSFALIMGASLSNPVMANQLTASVIIQEIAFHPAIVVIGLIASTISSALGALVGSARILQALARDELLPGISKFGYGSPGADEPRVALVLSWAIGQGCLFLGDLNTVSALISELFLLVYFSLNIACFALRVSGAPNFRPHFRKFSWRTALAGAVLALSVMFISSPLYALVAIGVVVVLAICVYLYAPPKPWGDVSQAIIFHQVRKYLLRLDIRRQHPKFWRPSILLCVDTPHSSAPLIDFCNSLKKGGLYLIGNVVVAEPSKRMSSFAEEMRLLWVDYIKITRIKAFSELCISASLRSGFYSMFMLSGIGGMKPNTVVFQFLPFEEGVDEDGGVESGGGGASKAADVWTTMGSRGGGGNENVDKGERLRHGSTKSQLEIDTTGSTSGGMPADGLYTPQFVLQSPQRNSQTSSNSNMRPSMLMLGSDLRRDRQIQKEQNVLDRMDSIRSKMEYVMQQSMEGNHEDMHGVDDGNDAGAGGPKPSSSLRAPSHTLMRSSSSMIESNAIGATDNLKDLVAIMGDALALKKNIVLARHFEKLDADKLRSFSLLHSNVGDARMSVDVWVTASDTANPDWDAMEGDLSLQVQLAYCLLAGRKTAWHKYTYIRVVVVTVVGSDASPEQIEEEKETCRLRTEFMLREIRVPAEVYVVSGISPAPSITLQAQRQSDGSGSIPRGLSVGSLPPPNLGLSDLNRLIKEETRNTAMLFLQLPDVPLENASTMEVGMYARSVKKLTDGLPPLVLVKSARQRTMTTEL